MKFKRRKIKRGRVEIIPMIDTIVILLIFYMTFARFAEANKANVKLPTSRAGDDWKQKPGQVIVNMFGAEDVRVGESRYTIGELSGVLTTMRNKDPYTYKDMSVILRANRSMTYEDLSQFMKACAKAKIVDVTFTTAENR